MLAAGCSSESTLASGPVADASEDVATGTLVSPQSSVFPTGVSTTGVPYLTTPNNTGSILDMLENGWAVGSTR